MEKSNENTISMMPELVTDNESDEDMFSSDDDDNLDGDNKVDEKDFDNNLNDTSNKNPIVFF